jgi:hypothetical protein
LVIYKPVSAEEADPGPAKQKKTTAKKPAKKTTSAKKSATSKSGR